MSTGPIPGDLSEEVVIDVVLALLGAVAVVALTHTGPGLANDTSRLAAAEALVEHGRYAIDGTHFEYTVDKIKVDGRFYSDKPPMLNLYLGGIYWLINRTLGWTMDGALPSVYFVLSLLSSGLAFVATLVGVRRLATRLGSDVRWAAIVALAGGFGTLAFPYSVVVSNHAVAAPFLVWCGFAMVDIAEADPERGTVNGFAAGLIGGIATVVEPLAALFVASLAVGVVAETRDWRIFGGILAGGLVPVIPHAAITQSVAGNPVLPNLDPSHFDWQGSMHTAENLSGVGWAHDSFGDLATYAYHSILGYRGGVMYNMPSALGSGVACWALIRGRRRWLFGALVAAGTAFLVLTIGWTSNYSGWAYGIRWHATPAPLFAAVIGAAIGTEGRARSVATLGTAATALLGTVAAAPGTLDPWTPSTHEAYSIVEVVSGERVYLEEHLEAAARHLREDRPFEARYQAEHALRRAESLPGAWEIAIRASVELGDRERLEHYRRRLEEGAGPSRDEVREQLLRVIGRSLESGN